MRSTHPSRRSTIRQLRGKPLIVGGLGGRGVVAAASYEVRKYGVHSAMPMREALQRCPHAVCVPPRFERYKEASEIVFDVFHEFTPLVQGLSLDEAFLDVTAQPDGARTGRRRSRPEIKAKILERTGLTASVGVAPNKLIAKIASDLRKPDGLVVVHEHEVTALLDPLSIRRLFGIGNKTAPQLEQLGIRTLRDLRLAPDAVLRPIFGRYAAQIEGTRGRHRRSAGHRRLGREAHLGRGDVRRRHRGSGSAARRDSRNSPTAWRRACALRSGWPVA